MQIEVRPYNPETDKGLVYSTLLKGLYYGNSYYHSIDKAAFFTNYQRVVDHLIGKPGVEVRVLGFSGDADTILGYAIVEGSTLHFMYSKTGWRKQGHTRLLVDYASIKNVTHITSAGNAIRVKQGWGHNPFLA